VPTYVAFLRAINLGATRKFPKDAIRAAVESTGATGVETYINTGNVRLTTSMRSRTKIEQTLERAFLADRGFEVPTIVLTPAELVEVAAHAAELGAGHDGRHYVELLREAPPPAVVEALDAISAEGGPARMHLTGRALHLLVDSDYSGAALLRASVEKQLGVTTNRNATVVRELAARWGS